MIAPITRRGVIKMGVMSSFLSGTRWAFGNNSLREGQARSHDAITQAELDFLHKMIQVLSPEFYGNTSYHDLQDHIIVLDRLLWELFPDFHSELRQGLSFLTSRSLTFATLSSVYSPSA
ncbi:hypothetical protein [Pseudobacteriovorax antillogorgiicola]|uniref:Uncharacterized protein n=1 Tax=Pseudobacteriovorax antillogorgiicola TaxID=1513793 RepID=A0A1Y6CLX9_9BACT|nr:hypothetical protein [Pseudobacteriovorax antillogorgiicola]TCS45000.1 hypothetical protein EDD56_13037 [Pseudobacteriovorax antillogorgiicola]SMF76501.1 hypothetical protein SAMN06296036_13037 [Pseudobacteriovorax antillogorgiicola]